MVVGSEVDFVGDRPLDLERALQALMGGDFWMRWDIAKELPVFGEAALSALIALAEDADLDPEIRWFAARTLGSYAPAAVLDTLIALLQEGADPDLLDIAAEGLSQLGAASIPALTTLLANPARRLLAVQTLGRVRHAATLEPLGAVVQDPDPAVRAAAIAALGNFRTPQVTPLLQAATTDPVAKVRQAAVSALGLRTYEPEVDALVQGLLPRLWEVDLAVRQATAIALGRLGTETAIAALAQVLQGAATPPELQLTALRALGWVQTPAALAVLITTLYQGARPLQLAVVESCTRLESPPLRAQARRALRQYLKDLLPHPAGTEIKRAIALALGQLQDLEAKPLLQTLLHDPDEQMQVYVQAALRQLVASA